MRRPSPVFAFTLIELLVVVAIVVVLLALLTPALDKAVYSAEMATCAARLKSLSTAVTTYAGANRRFYPNRPTTDPAAYWRRPNNLYDTKHDDRPHLKAYVELKLMIDPFCKPVDLAYTKPESHVFSSYNLWFGYRYTHTIDGGKGMYRIGDRLGFNGMDFDVLVGDQDIVMPAWPGSFASHPDSLNKLVNGYSQDQNLTVPGVPFTVAAPVSTQYTQSYYASRDPARGLLDTQYAFSAGDVRRYDKVEWDESYDDVPRFARVPLVNSYDETNAAGWTVHLPLR
jgi:prepilin-type N-terminal cleavage/methylation domain-containing protein